ncbi:MAG: GyrI-like domain-containing protein, partial [Gemmatimonadota bacterium]
MTYDLRVVEIAPQLTAVIRGQAAAEKLSSVIPAACGEVWQYMKAAGHPKPGHNVALYLDGTVTFEAGAEVSAAFLPGPKVFCSQLPGGTVATVTHVGDYQLAPAHQAIRNWCGANGRSSTLNWEIYGHGTDDPAKIRT